MNEKPTCPHCGLTDVSFQRTCHNSSCAAYADDDTVYEGWKPGAAPDECWKAEADTLRRIVLDALAEHDRENPSQAVPADHWTKRARQLFGID